MNHGARFRERVAALPAAGGRIHAQPGVVAEIVIDSPDRRNALSPQMMVALRDAASAVAGARVLLLRGEGGAFCAGGDLGAIRAHLADSGLGAELQAFMNDTLSAIEAAAPVRVAAVMGPALGGGAELLTAMSFVVASPGATVGWVQARMGLSPGFGGAARLVRQVGERCAMRLLLEARALGAEEAARAGLVDHVADDPVSYARDWCEAAAAWPPAVLHAAVEAVRGGPGAEATQFHGLWGGEAHQAALARSMVGRRA